MAEVITVAKPSAVATWTGDQAALMPGALRSVEPIHRSFEAISAWVDQADDVVEALQVAVDGVKAPTYAQAAASAVFSGNMHAGSATIAGGLTGATAVFSGDISAKNIAFGTAHFTVGTSMTYGSVSFGKTFSSVPFVVVSAVTAGSDVFCGIQPGTIAQTGFSIAAKRAASMDTVFNWIAIGTPGVV